MAFCGLFQRDWLRAQSDVLHANQTDKHILFHESENRITNYQEWFLSLRGPKILQTIYHSWCRTWRRWLKTKVTVRVSALRSCEEHGETRTLAGMKMPTGRNWLKCKTELQRARSSCECPNLSCTQTVPMEQNIIETQNVWISELSKNTSVVFVRVQTGETLPRGFLCKVHHSQEYGRETERNNRIGFTPRNFFTADQCWLGIFRLH